MLFRAMYANSDPFGDPAHPALSFLLNFPAANLSLHPLVLRIMPFLWLLAESLLLMKVTSRKGGRLAGLFALVLFACEIRCSHSLPLISDWDLAGLFLLTWLAFIQKKSEGVSLNGTKPVLLICLLLALGCMSSYMMIPVAGVFMTFIYLQYYKESLPGKIKLLPVFVFLSFLAYAVYIALEDTVPVKAYHGLWDFFAALFREIPSGRAFIMILPLAGGLLRLLIKRDDHSNSFVFLSILAIFFAVMVLYETGGLHGAYYFYPAIPLLIYATALFLADAHHFILSQFRSRRVFESLKLKYFSGFAAVLLMVLSFVSFTTAEELSYMVGVDNFDTFEIIQKISRKPVVTNFRNYEHVAVHNALKYELFPEGCQERLDNLTQSLKIHKLYNWEKIPKLLASHSFDNGYYLVLSFQGGQDRQLELDLTRNCRKLFKDKSNHNALMYLDHMPDTLHFYRCYGASE